jgi:hypothetical protein
VRERAPAARAIRAWAAALLCAFGTVSPLVGNASAAPLDFSGDGNVTDSGTFGVFGAALEVTLWASTGIAAGPLSLKAGVGGAYAWSFPQVPSTSLLNLTVRAWLPWDPNISAARVFDVSNGTPQTAYPGTAVPLSFVADERLALAAPGGELVLPRGRPLTVALSMQNTGNVSVAHTGFSLSLSSPTASALLVNPPGNQSEELPGQTFGIIGAFLAPANATLETLTASFSVVSTSGTNFTATFALRIAANRNAGVANITTAPLPPDEARPGQIQVSVVNSGADFAPGVLVQVQAYYATLPDVYLNSTSLDIAPGATSTASFGWTPLWSPDPVTVQASVTVQDDFDSFDDSAQAMFPIHSTNVAPSVSISSPVDGSRVAGNITVAGAASDPEASPIRLTVALDGGAPLFNATATSFGFVLDLSGQPDGPHTIVARAEDPRGLVGTASASITVLNRGPNAPPSVSIDSPEDGDTVGAAFVLRGTATDERTEISSVLVSLDGGPEQVAAGTAAWHLDVNGSALGAGPHRIGVRAFDGIDYSAPQRINVSVNPAPPASVAISGLSLAPSTIVPSAAFNGSGTATFDTGVLAVGANISGQIRGFTAVVSALTDSRGHFSLSFTAPSTAGNYTIDLVARSGALQGGGTLALHVTTSTLPDIELLPSGFALSPDPPPPQVPIHHTVEILNSGRVTANATLRVWDGPKGSGALIFEWAFTISNSRQAAFDYTYTPGTHNLTIVVEDVEPQDADLANNQMTISVPVADAPDFTIESLSPSVTDIHEGSNITFLVVVRNLATTSGFVQVELWDGVPLAANATKIHDERVSVAGMQRERVLIAWRPTRAGEHVIFAQAVLAFPQELILTNNLANVTVNVTAAPGEQPPSFLPGFGGAGAAVAGSGAAAWRRRQGGARQKRPRKAAAGAGLLLLAFGLAAAIAPAPSAATVADASAMPGPLSGVCQTCHVSPQGGGPLNPFGADYKAEQNQTGGAVDWVRLGGLDSDRDGTSNQVEWQGSYLPGDPNSNPQTGIRYSGFGGGGVSGLVTGLVALLVISLAGVGLGFWMLNKRIARKAAEAEEASAKDEAPPAPKP